MARHCRERTGDTQRPFCLQQSLERPQKAYLGEILLSSRNFFLIKLNFLNPAASLVGQFPPFEDKFVGMARTLGWFPRAHSR